VSVLVVAGAPVAESALYADLINQAEYVIAADAGADLCLSVGRVPDMFVGDADSVTPLTLTALADRMVDMRISSSDKDVSDLDLALAVAAEHAADEVVVTAAWGGRADHSLAVIGSLLDAWALRPVLAEPEVFAGWVVAAGAREALKLAGEGRTVSILAGPGGATVSVTGTKWPLEKEPLLPLSRRGLSNLIAGGPARITVHSGTALVLSQADASGHISQGDA